ncbi:hypothetical protein [Amycolatopsis pigmentata]|uniref:Uncharacterized protein n=1 Tax=Amycolatopsis pigmentata TaxID=450801 RepID=A0ABW5G3A0_9PSEU
MANQILDLTPSGPLDTLAKQIQSTGVVSTGQLRFHGMLSWQPTDTPPLNIRPYDAYYGIIGMFRAGHLLNVKDYTETAWNAMEAFQADMDGNGYTHDYVWANRQFRDGTINSTGVLTSPAQAQFTPSDVGSPIAGAGLSGTVTIGAYLSTTQVQLSGTTSAVTIPQIYNILTYGPAGQWVVRAPQQQDSTDAYAALFLLALYQGFQSTRDYERIRNFEHGAVAALMALVTTRQTDSQFLALPNGLYNSTLLEDCTEVYTGLRAAAYLFGPRQIIPGHPDISRLAERFADEIQGFIHTWWDYTNPGRTVSPVGMVAGSNRLTGSFLPTDVKSSISSGSPGVPLGATITDILPNGTAVLDAPATATNASGSVTTVVTGYRMAETVANVPQQDLPDWSSPTKAYEQPWFAVEGRLATSLANHLLYAQPEFYANSEYAGGFGEEALLDAGRRTEALVTALSYANSTYAVVSHLSPPFGYPFTIGKYGMLMVVISARSLGTFIPPHG